MRFARKIRRNKKQKAIKAAIKSGALLRTLDGYKWASALGSGDDATRDPGNPKPFDPDKMSVSGASS